MLKQYNLTHEHLKSLSLALSCCLFVPGVTKFTPTPKNLVKLKWVLPMEESSF